MDFDDYDELARENIGDIRACTCGCGCREQCYGDICVDCQHGDHIDDQAYEDEQEANQGDIAEFVEKHGYLPGQEPE